MSNNNYNGENMYNNSLRNNTNSLDYLLTFMPSNFDIKEVVTLHDKIKSELGMNVQTPTSQEQISDSFFKVAIPYIYYPSRKGLENMNTGNREEIYDILSDIVQKERGMGKNGPNAKRIASRVLNILESQGGGKRRGARRSTSRKNKKNTRKTRKNRK